MVQLQESRRDFLTQLLYGATLCHLLSISAGAKSQSAADIQSLLPTLRVKLLGLINEERSIDKLQELQLDDLATAVATKHAEEMAVSGFASHWSRNGFKPYMRYSFAGGVAASEENISAADNTWSMKAADLLQDISYLHVRLYQETPPSDGHRKAILAPQHTHVGIGIAVSELRLRMVELFIARYVEVNQVQRESRPKETVTFSGRLLKHGYRLQHVEVFFEPTPQAPELEWLRVARSYSLPSRSVILRPKLLSPLTYVDHSVGEIRMEPDGSFSVPVKLFAEEKGIYTLVGWLKDSKTNKAFPATQVCIRAE